MKITTNTPATVFKPITIELVIESAEELKALQDMSAYDVSIPELCGEEVEEGLIYKFLTTLGNTLHSC